MASILLFLMACKPKVESEISVSEPETEIETVEINPEFVDFYNRFHSDTAFQKRHILFPLKKKPLNDNGEIWTVDNWVIHKPFSSYQNTFRRDFESMGDALVVERIIDAGGHFNMERRFAKLSNGWQLIFYSAETKGR